MPEMDLILQIPFDNLSRRGYNIFITHVRFKEAFHGRFTADFRS